jgi:hypothetical protein
MPDPIDAPPHLVAAVRTICLALPEVIEEPAWTGTRWCVRGKNFAHVVFIENGWPPAYANAAGSDGPRTVLTFRAPSAELDAPTFRRPPFFKPVWFPDIVGMTIDGDVDWREVAELLSESYCLLAPKKLAAMVERSSRRTRN